MPKPTLLIADDDPAISRFVLKIAESKGFAANAVADGKKLLNALSVSLPDIIVLDIVMPDMDGLEVLGELAARGIQTPIILISGYEQNYIDAAFKIGSANGLPILGALFKPFGKSELACMLDKM